MNNPNLKNLKQANVSRSSFNLKKLNFAAKDDALYVSKDTFLSKINKQAYESNQNFKTLEPSSSNKNQQPSQRHVSIEEDAE